MSAPRRKLSFLGYAPPGAPDPDGRTDDAAGDLRLDDEMRGVWERPQLEEAGGALGTGGRRVAARSRKSSMLENRRSRTSPRDSESVENGAEGADGVAGGGAGGSADGGTETEAEAEAHQHGFVQLDELVWGVEDAESTENLEGGGGEWRQRARWIKYEQDVEEDAARWGRPHVASLSFHSLLNLRRCLQDGVVLLGRSALTASSLWEALADALLEAELLDADESELLLQALHLRHTRPHARNLRFSISSRKQSHVSLHSLRGARVAASPGSRRQSAPPQTINASVDAKRRSSVGGGVLGGGGPADRKKSVLGALAAAAAATAAAAVEEARRARADSVLRRVPQDAEVSSVLVGAAPFLRRPVAAFVRLHYALRIPEVTEVPLPVRFVFLLLGPADAELDYTEVGRSIGTLMANPSFNKLARRADDRAALLAGINEFLDDSIVLPPGDWERQALLPVHDLRAKSQHIRRRKWEAMQRRASMMPPSVDMPAAAMPLLPPPRDEEKALLARLDAEFPCKPPRRTLADQLARTGRPFGGMVRDMRHRYALYASDLRDGLHSQCAAAALFMYFAAVSSAIAFGGLYDEKTYGALGITETLLATSAGGVVFALAAGQPLMITGATGPLLLLDDALSRFCREHQLDFLAMRAYAGAWMLAIALAVAAFEGSVAVKKMTRFTEDIFALLICVIFISEALSNMIRVFHDHPLNADYCSYNSTTGIAGDPGTMPPQPNAALFATTLTLGTFIIAYYLRIFRNSKFLGRSVRRALGDFGVPLAIALMVALSAGVPVYSERLSMPPGVEPTTPRGWFVPLSPGFLALPPWAALSAMLPALMVYIIVFIETHIAELIVDKPERRLCKGSGFHMDIVVISAVNALCGVLGAPWQCVATVRSVSHVAALTELSTTHAPGDKPYIVRVREQRVTGLVVSVLVGLSVLAGALLRLVPLAVLFGVFLYMGVSALAGIQLWERCVLLLQPVKHHPPAPYVRRVPTPRMHAYTLVQLAVLAALLAVKASPASLALPLLLAATVPLRLLLLPRFFSATQLRALDGQQPDLDKDDEPDFYEEAPLPG